MAIAVKYFYEKVPSQISDRTLNTPRITIGFHNCCRGVELCLELVMSFCFACIELPDTS